MTTIHIPPGEGQNYRMIDGDHVAKAVVQDSAGSFEVFEVVAPAARMAPPHVSPWSGVLYLVEGQVRALVGETSYDVQPGGARVAPEARTPDMPQVPYGVTPLRHVRQLRVTPPRDRRGHSR